VAGCAWGWVETECDGRYRATTSLEFEDVRDALRYSRARTKIVVLDCCFAGLAIEPEAALGPSFDVADRAACDGAYTMAASAAFEIARYEQGEDVTQPLTFFTKCFAEVVLAGDADEGPTLSLDVIFRRLVSTMRAQCLPQPTQANRGMAATFPFCRNVAAHRTDVAAPDGPPVSGTSRRAVVWRTAVLLTVLATVAAAVVFLVGTGDEPTGESAPTTERSPDRRVAEAGAPQSESSSEPPPASPDTRPPSDTQSVVPSSTVTPDSPNFAPTALLMCRHSNNDFVFRMLPACIAPYHDGKWSVGSGYLFGQEEPGTIPLYEHYCTGECHGFAENRYYSRGSGVDPGNGWPVQDATVRVFSDCTMNPDGTDGDPNDGLQPIYQVLYLENRKTVRKYTVRTASELAFPGLGAPSYVEFLGCTWQ
jgi:hypothetical protein